MGRTCTPTPSCLVAPPCTQVLPTECKRKSLPWLHPPSRSKSLLHLRENTPCGLEDPSWLPLYLPTDVDHQARIRRMRPIHCPQEVLLNIWLMPAFNLLYMLSALICYRHVNFNIPKRNKLLSNCYLSYCWQ